MSTVSKIVEYFAAHLEADSAQRLLTTELHDRFCNTYSVTCSQREFNKLWRETFPQLEIKKSNANQYVMGVNFKGDKRVSWRVNIPNPPRTEKEAKERSAKYQQEYRERKKLMSKTTTVI